METLVLSAQPAGVSFRADSVAVLNRCWRGYLPVSGLGHALGLGDLGAALAPVAVAPTAPVTARFATTRLPFAGSAIAAHVVMTAAAAAADTAVAGVQDMATTAPKQADKPVTKRDDRLPLGDRPEAPPS